MSEQFDEQGNLITTQGNSVDREAQYKALQAGFTKQAQELAALRNSGSNEGTTAEERAAYIKQTAQEEALKVKQSLVSEQQLEFLIDNNPSLRPYEKAIKEIANAKGVAFEDVIEEYGFGSLDKLQKAKERSLVGDRGLQETPQRSINDLSSKEREERKAANIKRDMLKDSGSI
ncbi:MAG TPA: hypothetical protein PLW93_03115 [Candidatus Absconditabacterales bacterium]|nr:hypothetical protein [Candidatus Absconditabacterales bacterium]